MIKEVKFFYSENYKTLIKETEDDLKKRESLCTITEPVLSSSSAPTNESHARVCALPTEATTMRSPCTATEYPPLLKTRESLSKVMKNQYSQK